jgi:general secretion pathway protein G
MQAIRTRKSGFTLVEILIVVIILGILAAIVIPQFTNASQDARRSSLQSTVQTLRSQISLYKLQHHDTTPVLADFWDQLSQYTDDLGDFQLAKDATHIYGPYVQTIPNNSMVPDAVKQVVVAVPSAGVAPVVADADGTQAYFYDAGSGKVWAVGKDDDGAYIIIGD